MPRWRVQHRRHRDRSQFPLLQKTIAQERRTVKTCRELETANLLPLHQSTETRGCFSSPLPLSMADLDVGRRTDSAVLADELGAHPLKAIFAGAGRGKIQARSERGRKVLKYFSRNRATTSSAKQAARLCQHLSRSITYPKHWSLLAAQDARGKQNRELFGKAACDSTGGTTAAIWLNTVPVAKRKRPALVYRDGTAAHAKHTLRQIDHGTRGRCFYSAVQTK